jgi:hypothetical protein
MLLVVVSATVVGLLGTLGVELMTTKPYRRGGAKGSPAASQRWGDRVCGTLPWKGPEQSYTLADHAIGQVTEERG